MISLRASYRVWLRDPRWQQCRLRIFERDAWRCQICGSTQRALHVHHLRYTRYRLPWESDAQDLLTVCQTCHGDNHMASGRIQEPSRLSEPQITDIKTIPLDQFTLLLADADNGKKYMERHEWEHVAHMHDTKKRPGYILWSEFLWPGDATTTGGNGDRLRKDLEKIFGVGQVQFSDTEGHDWIIIELAMGFAEHINPALKVRILEIFRKHGLKILYEGEEPVMDLETLSDEHKYALMMKWHTEAIQKMSTEITIVKETALQASETAHHANDTAVAAEQKADDALRKAALAFENVKWLSVEQWVIGEKLLRKFPEKTWSTLGKKLGDYCSLYNLEVKTFTVNGKPWPEEKFYPPEAFSWLLRQKNFLQKTMGW